MLTHHRLPVCLSVVSTDLPIWFTVENDATLYQKGQERFHLLLREPALEGWKEKKLTPDSPQLVQKHDRRLLWLEISPYRVSMTMQGNDGLSYRHLWEQGVFGISRYWLQGASLHGHQSLQLRNYTRLLRLEGRLFPRSLELEYELWSDKVQLGRYLLTLQIDRG